MKIINYVFVLLTIMMVIMFFGVYYINNLKDDACMKIGYDHYRSTEDFSFCVDEEGNLHYVNWGYNKFPNDVWVKEISVGDVRTVNGV